MTFMCKNGHLHSKQFLAEDCATCRRNDTRRREREHAAQPDREFYRGVIAALGALKGMESPDSVHYHEVVKTFDLKALVRVARSEKGDMEWSGLGEYRRHRRKVEEYQARNPLPSTRPCRGPQP